MCTDTDTAADPDTDTFILIGPCGDLCRAVPYGLTDGRVPYFLSLLVLFPAIFSYRWKKKNMQKISTITKEETEQLTELVRENVRLCDQSCRDDSNAPFTSMTAASCVVCTKEKLAALLLP